MIPLVKSNASFLRRVELLVTQCPFMSPLLRCSSVALVLINFFLGSSRSVATDYYVSPAGNNSNPGTLAQPWATIAKGISTAGAGDTVFVRAGTYAEKLNLNGKIGTAANRITYRNYPAESPIIDPSSTTGAAIVRLRNCKYITIQGFEIRNFVTSSNAVTPIGIEISGSGEGIEIRDNKIHKIWQNYPVLNDFSANGHGLLVAGSSSTAITDLLIDGNEIYDLRLGASEAVAINGNIDGFTITNNIVHHCNNIGIDVIGFEGTNSNVTLDFARNGLIAQNEIHDIDSAYNPAYGGSLTTGGGARSAGGVYVDGGALTVIERNHIYQCNFGIEVGCENTGHNADQVIVRNNLLRHNHQGGIFVGGFSAGVGGTTNSSFTHNTLYQNDVDGVDNGQINLQNNISGTEITHNIIVCNTSTKQFILNHTTTCTFATDSIDWNLYSGTASGSAEFEWQRHYKNSFTAWRTASGQDSHSVFVTSVDFVNPAGFDFSLQVTSAAVDAGDPLFTPAVGELDFEGNARVAGAAVDIGMAEFGSSAPNRPLVTTEDPTLVDYNTATLNGLANPNAFMTDTHFEYGATIAYGERTSTEMIGDGTAALPVSAPLTGLTHKKVYHYRLVATSANGTTFGADKTFTTPAMPVPVVTVDPQPQLVALGTPATFDFTAIGGTPQTVRWRKNNVSISGTAALASTYVIPATALSHAGNYSVLVTNASGTDLAAAAPLGIVNAAPSTVIVNENATLTLTVSASAPTGLLSYEWLKDGNPLPVDARIAGANGTKLTIKAANDPDAGNYVCRVTMGTLTLDTGARTVSIRHKPIVDPLVPILPWTVSGSVTDIVTAQNVPTSFRITGLPSGVTYNRYTGQLSGKPVRTGSYTVKIAASNLAGTSPTISTTIPVSALPDAGMGTFHGLVDRHLNMSQDFLGGMFRLSTSATGAASGTLTFGARTWRFRGRLDAVEGIDPTARILVSRGRTLPALTFSITINKTSGAVTGTITDGIDTVPATGVRNAWHSRNHPATDFAGQYTALLTPPAILDSDPVYPKGHGYGIITVATSGAIRWAGRMADGGSVVHTTIMDAAGLFPFQRLLNRSLGSAQGWISIHLDGASAFADNDVGGDVSWFKKPETSASARNYRDGFPDHTLAALGSRWLRPASGDLLLNLPLPPSVNNIQVNLTHGGIDTAAQAAENVQAFSLRTNHTAIVSPGFSNKLKMTISLNSRSGAMSGRFTLSDPNPSGGTRPIVRTAYYYGVMLRLQKIGGGYFLLPGLPDPLHLPPITSTNSDILSGRMDLAPSPPLPP